MRWSNQQAVYVLAWISEPFGASIILSRTSKSCEVSVESPESLKKFFKNSNHVDDRIKTFVLHRDSLDAFKRASRGIKS